MERSKNIMNTNYKTLTRSTSNRMIAGVCAGLGDYLGIDPTIVRLLAVLAFFTGFGGLPLCISSWRSLCLSRRQVSHSNNVWLNKVAGWTVKYPTCYCF
jgi:phage shock protein PspC (stress-responsive transcriptional regulator)